MQTHSQFERFSRASLVGLLLPFGFLLAIIVAANFQTIFLLDWLAGDDQIAYYHGLFRERVPHFAFESNYVAYFIEPALFRLLAFSPWFARLVNTLAFFVPTACGLYWLYRREMGLAPEASLLAAGLPFVLPYQDQLPAIVWFSYTARCYALLLVSILAGLRFLKAEGRAAGAFGVFAIFALLVSEQSEQSLFLWPAVLWLFGGYGRRSRKHLWLFGAIAVVAVLRAAHIYHDFRVEALRKHAIDASEMWIRLSLFLKWTLPVPSLALTEEWPGAAMWKVMIAELLIIAAGTAMGPAYFARKPLANEHVARMRPAAQTIYVMGYFAALAVFPIVIFLVRSRWYPVRYTIFSAVGVSGLFAIGSHVVAERATKSFPRGRAILPAVAIGLLVLCAAAKNWNSTHVYAQDERFIATLRQALEPLALPPDSQIVVETNHPFQTKNWQYSAGILAYTLNRKDMFGNFSSFPNDNLRDHYGQDRRTELDEPSPSMFLQRDKPLFLFRHERGDDRFRRVPFLLQWKDAGRDAAWEIVKTDLATGAQAIGAAGIGWDAYQEAAWAALSQARPLDQSSASEAGAAPSRIFEWRADASTIARVSADGAPAMMVVAPVGSYGGTALALEGAPQQGVPYFPDAAYIVVVKFRGAPDTAPLRLRVALRDSVHGITLFEQRFDAGDKWQTLHWELSNPGEPGALEVVVQKTYSDQEGKFLIREPIALVAPKDIFWGMPDYDEAVRLGIVTEE